MKANVQILLLAALFSIGYSTGAPAQEPDTVKNPPPAADIAKLAEQGHALLKKYCHRCHGLNFEVPGFDVLNREVMLAPKADKRPSYIVAGKPDISEVWTRVAINGDMPPSDAAQLTDDDKETLRAWIIAGAPFPAPKQRPFLTELKVINAIQSHLSIVPPAERKFQRYFTLTHIYDNHRAIDEQGLRQYRAALSKLVNSLSWKNKIVLPQSIDSEESILHVDIRSFGWDKTDVWSELLKIYPYGLKYDQHPDPQLREASEKLMQTSGNELLWVRADWFIATASRPPLYHLFLQLPKLDTDLQKTLNVNVKDDFIRNNLARAGFAGSGVSGQNRLVDRHHSLYGHYWQSYDFETNLGRGSLVQFPLGPEFPGNKFNEQAFKHDGGEIIFSLPNGLQGYLLVEKNGKRIDVGPTNIVSDTLKTAGTAAIVNALSCMACHKHGVIRFKDTVRDGIAVSGEARIKVQKLFPKQETMDALMAKDEARFLAALDLATARFLKVGSEAERNIRDFAEPISAVAQNYNKDLGPVEAALELGIENPERLQVMVQGNRRLAQFGLGQFKDGATIKRDQWASLQDDETLFHRTARELDLGTPVRK